MKAGRRKGGAAIPAVIDTGRRKRSNMAQPVFKSTTGRVKGGAAQNIIEITSEDLVQNGGQYKLMGGAPISMEMVAGRRSKQGAAQVVYPVDILGNYDPSFAGYIYKVLTSTDIYDASSLIQFLPQNELSGGVSFDHSGLGHNGAYTAVDLGQPGVPGMGMSAAGYRGAASFNNIYSVSLNGVFNGDEGAALIWDQVANAAVWTDGTARWMFLLQVNAANQIYIARSGTDNRVSFVHAAGGNTESHPVSGLSNLTMACYGITWSKSGDLVNYYIDGVSQGTDTGLLAWAGNLSATKTLIGAISTVPASVWKGNSAPFLLFNETKTPAEMLYLSTV